MRAILLSSTLALTLCVRTSFAQESSAADISAARALGTEGVKLADSGKCDEAIDKLARAEKLFHAPTTQGRLGECQVKLGKLVEGSETLNRVTRDALAPNAPPAFAAAQKRAATLLAEVRPRIPQLTISVDAPSSAVLTVTIDGQNVPVANLGTSRPTDPGTRSIQVSAPGYLTVNQQVTVKEAEAKSIKIDLQKDPSIPEPTVAPVVTTPPPATTVAPPPPPAATSSSSRAPLYLSIAVTGAGVAVGTVFGVLALAKSNDLKTACNADKVCPKESQDTVDNGKTFGTVSTIGFIAGGVGLVGTVVFLLTGHSEKEEKSIALPTVGPGSIQWSGRF